MDAQSIYAELDQLFREGKVDGAETRMNQLLAQAKSECDHSVCLMLYNELSGLYRSTGRIPLAVDASDKALSTVNIMGLSGTIHHATTLLNAATANRMAGDRNRSLKQFLEARSIFKSIGSEDSYEMAGLLNNISQLYQEQGYHDKALLNLDKALSILGKLGGHEADVATTRINRATSCMELGKMDEAESEIAESLKYFESPAGQTSGHLSAALSAAGQLAYKKGNYIQAKEYFEKALNITRERFGENYAAEVIRKNLDEVKKHL